LALCCWGQKNNKKLCYRKDDRPMRPMYGLILFTPTSTTLRGFDSERRQNFY